MRTKQIKKLTNEDVADFLEKHKDNHAVKKFLNYANEKFIVEFGDSYLEFLRNHPTKESQWTRKKLVDLRYKYGAGSE